MFEFVIKGRDIFFDCGLENIKLRFVTPSNRADIVRIQVNVKIGYYLSLLSCIVRQCLNNEKRRGTILATKNEKN